jgi:hypothetical protein
MRNRMVTRIRQIVCQQEKCTLSLCRVRGFHWPNGARDREATKPLRLRRGPLEVRELAYCVGSERGPVPGTPVRDLFGRVSGTDGQGSAMRPRCPAPNVVPVRSKIGPDRSLSTHIQKCCPKTTAAQPTPVEGLPPSETPLLRRRCWPMHRPVEVVWLLEGVVQPPVSLRVR